MGAGEAKRADDKKCEGRRKKKGGNNGGGVELKQKGGRELKPKKGIEQIEARSQFPLPEPSEEIKDVHQTPGSSKLDKKNGGIQVKALNFGTTTEDVPECQA